MSPGDKVNILLVDDQPAKLLSYEVILADLQENLIKANSATEALHSLPGLYVTDDLSYQYLGSRGFNRLGDYNSRFQLSVNGVRSSASRRCIRQMPWSTTL